MGPVDAELGCAPKADNLEKLNHIVVLMMLRTPADYTKNAERMKASNAFIYHLSEGTEPGLVSEYDTMRDCLQPTLAAIHCSRGLRPEA